MSFDVISNSTFGSCVKYVSELADKLVCRKQLQGERPIFVYKGTTPEDVARIDRSILIAALNGGVGDAKALSMYLKERVEAACALAFPVCCDPLNHPTPAGLCITDCEKLAFINRQAKELCTGDVFPVVDNVANPDAICSSISTSAAPSLRANSLSLLTVLGVLVSASRSKTQLVMLTTAAALLAMNVYVTELAQSSST
ncbi:MAG: hypothetical protein KR126chlam2_00831 [Chlamydiae bacterium]|nr:hypothetical protein [Chlamydiota bacterium]